MENTMVNMYVHAHVLGLPEHILEDDEFVERFWAEMPDASIGAHDGVFGVTVSQFALSDHRGGPRQLERIRRALAAIGYPGVVVLVEEIVREGWRDDVQVLAGMVRWHWSRLTTQGEGGENEPTAA
jgi:hypothetical protein